MRRWWRLDRRVAGAAGWRPFAWLLAAAAFGLAAPAAGERGLDAQSSRTVRVDGQPERFVMCDRPNGPPTLGIMLGRRVVAVQRLLGGEAVALDWRHCEPPLMARPSVQCRVTGGTTVVHIDVRLADRVRRIGRGTFGERWEYHTLRLRRLRGEEAVSWTDDEIELPADEMFEDRVVRGTGHFGASGSDSCGFGFLVIRSHVEHGASLALYALSPSDGLDSLAVSQPLGGPQRWRDVIGIADVIGDGQPQIVEIADPHAAGRLQVARVADGRIEPISALDGYTSHRFGTPRQGIGALMDFTGDGVADIVVPTGDWKCLAVVTAQGGVLRERGRLSCADAPIVDVLAVDLDGDGRDDLIAARRDGTVESWIR